MVWRNVDPIIENKLYLGNLVAARSTRSLTGITPHHMSSPFAPKRSRPNCRSLASNICASRSRTLDYADLLIHLPSACQFIHQALQAGGTVLVHDVQGISRSAAVVAAYLMWTQRLNATRALETIRRARDQIWPNAGFQEQLVLFELCQYAPSPMNGIYRSWRTKLEQRLRAAGML
ncbi:MAP kinase phosphatase 2 [Mycena chlorophos]|uniref:protein-tyrosine-phosphatase n=1 Tax=Mycena chlorophos TaxID=658473 RepID=A0A8H6S3A8_MYCCL|nr:MAP kinase phosphatase 2 [Mycena chlorophos]